MEEKTEKKSAGKLEGHEIAIINKQLKALLLGTNLPKNAAKYRAYAEELQSTLSAFVDDTNERLKSVIELRETLLQRKDLLAERQKAALGARYKPNNAGLRNFSEIKPVSQQCLSTLLNNIKVLAQRTALSPDQDQRVEQIRQARKSIKKVRDAIIRRRESIITHLNRVNVSISKFELREMLEEHLPELPLIDPDTPINLLLQDKFFALGWRSGDPLAINTAIRDPSIPFSDKKALFDGACTRWAEGQVWDQNKNSQGIDCNSNNVFTFFDSLHEMITSLENATSITSAAARMHAEYTEFLIEKGLQLVTQSEVDHAPYAAAVAFGETGSDIWLLAYDTARQKYAPVIADLIAICGKISPEKIQMDSSLDNESDLCSLSIDETFTQAATVHPMTAPAANDLAIPPPSDRRPSSPPPPSLTQAS